MTGQTFVAASSLEDQLVSILLDPNHLYLMIGIFSVLSLLKYMGPTQALFSDKFKWLIAPINLGLSFVGVFAFGLTDATTLGMKVIIALAITAFTVLSYETLGKYVFKAAESRISKKNGNNQ